MCPVGRWHVDGTERGGVQGLAGTSRLGKRKIKGWWTGQRSGTFCIMGHARIPEGDLILFDGTCMFCSAFARFVVRWDRAGHFRCISAHSPLWQALYVQVGLDGQAMATNIVVVHGVPHIKLRAFTAAMRRIGWPWRLCAVLDLIPRGLAGLAYDWIARIRYRLGRRDCPLPGPALRARLIE